MDFKNGVKNMQAVSYNSCRHYAVECKCGKNYGHFVFSTVWDFWPGHLVTSSVLAW